MRPKEEATCVYKKKTLAGLDSTQHMECTEGAEHWRKKRKKTAYLFSRWCGIFTSSRRFMCRYRSRASGFQNIRRDVNRSLGHAQ